MDAINIILIAIALIIVLIVIFTIITYFFLDIFRHQAGEKTVKAMQKQDKKKRK